MSEEIVGSVDMISLTNREIYDMENLISGLLLSDGCIKLNKNKSNEVSGTARYTQSCVNVEWLEKIKEHFSLYGVESTIDTGSFLSGGYHSYNIIYGFRTRSYLEFKKLYYKWYPEGKKIVPDDIELTPDCVANWYFGDGCISKTSKIYNVYQIRLATCGFEIKYTRFLSELLNTSLGINSHVDKTNIIRFSRHDDVLYFLDYIKDYWISCFSYKFPADLLYQE